MNKPTKAIAALCLLNSASVHALGVGEIKTHSALNQLLNAQIPLVGSKKEDPSNIRISIASREAFAKAGIDRPHYLTELKFTPTLAKNGEITVDVSSSSTIKEPFINFILDVEWPQGRTLKEFTILLDPPVTMSDVRTTPIALAETPTITAPTSQAVSQPITPATTASTSQYGATKSSDTIWSIAKKLMNNNHTATHQQMMLALYDNNPEAFYKNNINALKKGAILQIPSNEQINSRTVAQANNEYNEQQALWSSFTKTASTPTAVAKANDKLQPIKSESNLKKKLENNKQEAKLTLLTPEQESTSEVAVEGNTAETPTGSTNPINQANIAIEMAATLEEENKEVKSRLNDLELQVNKLQRLLTLKDEQLAQLQSQPSTVEPAPAAKNQAINTKEPISEEGSDYNLALYGGGLIIALLALFLARRKKETSNPKDADTFNETPPFTETAAEESISSTTSLEEEPLLSEFTPSEFNANQHTQEADPLTECDVYIAYGRFQQAEDLITNALKDDPDNLSYKLKLLDIYFSSANSDAFEELASSLSALKESDPDTWNNISDMGVEINPDSKLFLPPLNEEIETPSISATEQKSASANEIEYHEEPQAAEEPVNEEIEIPSISAAEQQGASANEIEYHEHEKPQAAEEPVNETTNSEFEFDFDLIKNEPTLEEPADTHEHEADPHEDMELTLDEIEIDAPPSNSSSDNFDAQFALAQASIEMEDTESAHHTLSEILAS